MRVERPLEEPLTVHSAVLGDTRVLVLHGELDLATAGQLAAVLDAAAHEPGRIVLDLAGLGFMDATGLRVLIRQPEPVAARLELARVSPQVQELFALTEIEPHMPYRMRPSRRPFGERNVEYVERLWKLFDEGGAEAMLQIVPDGVRWEPLRAGGRAITSSRELRDFWAERTDADAPRHRATSFTPLDDTVLVRADRDASAGADSVIWSLYEFAGDRLTAARSYAGAELRITSPA